MKKVVYLLGLLALYAAPDASALAACGPPMCNYPPPGQEDPGYRPPPRPGYPGDYPGNPPGYGCRPRATLPNLNTAAYPCEPGECNPRQGCRGGCPPCP
jgi:hypothetical protein